MSILQRLEQYTARHPQEVLRLTATLPDGEADEIIIFRGFSSSLMRSTAVDPDVPILPPEAEIGAIDRLEAPYNPAAPRYIAQELSLAEMLAIAQQG